MPETVRRIGLRALVTALWLAGAYYFVLGGEYSALDVRALQAEREMLNARIDSLAAVTDSLEVWADSLKSSPEAIERVARERYGFIRDGERLYRFIEVDASGRGRVDD